MPKRFSTVRGREFGDGPRTAIAAAGFSSRALAERVDWDEAKLSGLVNGKGGISDVELGVLLGLCGLNPVERDHLLSLFRLRTSKAGCKSTEPAHLSTTAHWPRISPRPRR